MEKTINRYVITLVVLMAVFSVSCREDSDEVLYYSEWSIENFEKANTSMEGQFKAFWTAMNSNYPIWDYEAEYGLDWDAVYEKYLLVFRNADLKYKKDGVAMPDSVFEGIYEEIIAQLHDGHTTLNIANLHTGTIHTLSPSLYRIYKKDKWYDEYLFSPNTAFYESELVDEDKRIVESVIAFDTYQYALFNDNIVYLRMKDCNLPLYFDAKNADYDDENSVKARKVWTQWFETVQALHNNRMLKGIIIDVRNNGGGFAEISKYAFGALHNNRFLDINAYHRGYIRFKSGIGRFDYLPKVHFLWSLCEEKHADITEPIIVLANSITASAAEHICLDAKQRPNACVIGTNTMGAFAPLSTRDDSLYYMGHVGKKGITSFYMVIPSAAFMTDDGSIIEGKGVMPDIEIPLDFYMYSSSSRDNQLECALAYIRKKSTQVKYNE